MTLRSTVEQEIRELIQQHGRITFARFMQACLYSPGGGFYSSKDNRTNYHFGTSPTSHPVFGALIARQLEQMWHLLGDPPVFHVLEVGSGNGSLAQSIVDACRGTAPWFSRVLRYVAADYEPERLPSPEHTPGRSIGNGDWTSPNGQEPKLGIQRVKTEGVRAFQGIVGCILSNELIDNFPVHRFAIEGGRVKEVYITAAEGNLTEILDEPSSPCIEKRLAGLGLSLPDGYRGEVNLAIEDWTCQISQALDLGFVLTIDYGELADDLYSLQNAGGTLVCFDRHVISSDPYQNVGEQDITCQVDFTSLRRLGDRHGLATVGYNSQSQFLGNLGFSSFLDVLPAPGLSDARTELNRMGMMTLVDPDEYGDFKVLAQAKGMGFATDLLGFEGPPR